MYAFSVYLPFSFRYARFKKSGQEKALFHPIILLCSIFHHNFNKFPIGHYAPDSINSIYIKVLPSFTFCHHILTTDPFFKNNPNFGLVCYQPEWCRGQTVFIFFCIGLYACCLPVNFLFQKRNLCLFYTVLNI